MKQPTARDVARDIRDQIRERGVTHDEIAAAARLSHRQLRRRLDGETMFKAHEMLAIAQFLDDPAHKIAA